MSRPVIDWRPSHQWPPDTIECRCGAVFRSRAKGVTHEGRFTIFLETPCPTCGADADPKRASSDPETWTIGEA